MKIPKSNILKEVMRVVKSARKEILATMDLSEEIRTPLPQKYFLLLNKKLNEGVVIKRLAFGTTADFVIIKKTHRIKNRNYQFLLAKTKDYKRMLLVDRERLFFAKGRGERRSFFFTTNPRHILGFFNYFKTQPHTSLR